MTHGEGASFPFDHESLIIAALFGRPVEEVESWPADRYYMAVNLIPVLTLRGTPSRDG